jgi:hypothetical protein
MTPARPANPRQRTRRTPEHREQPTSDPKKPLRRKDLANRATLAATTNLEAAGIEPASGTASRATSTSVVPVFISPVRRPGTRLRTGQPRCMSRPAPRRHRAARLLVLTSGPLPAAGEAVDVRPEPELFRLYCLRSEGDRCVVRTYIFPGFTSPGLDSPSHDPRPRRIHTPPWAPAGGCRHCALLMVPVSRRRRTRPATTVTANPVASTAPPAGHSGTLAPGPPVVGATPRGVNAKTPSPLP